MRKKTLGTTTLSSGRHFKSKAATKWMKTEWRETLFSLIDSRFLRISRVGKNWVCDVAALQDGC